MTTEKEMDERVKKGFNNWGDLESTSWKVTTISITKETKDRLDDLGDTYDEAIAFLLAVWEGSEDTPTRKIHNDLHNSRKTTEWKVSKDRKTIVRYVICGTCRYIFRKEKKEISPDMRDMKDSRLIEYLTTPVRVE